MQAAHGGSNNDASRVLIAVLAYAAGRRVQILGPKYSGDVREFHAGGAAPEPIESVEVSRLFGEDMDDEVEVVEQDPFGAGVALHQ